MSEVSPELVERMVYEFRRIAEVRHPTPHFAWNWIGTAREIVAKLPKPVDPDLIEARASCERVIPSGGAFVSGEWDEGDIVRAALAGIKRGRELAGQPA